MRTIAEIKAIIEKLPPEQFAQLRDWVLELDAERWDAQLETDAAAGKLDALAARAIKDLSAHRCTDR